MLVGSLLILVCVGLIVATLRPRIIRWWKRPLPDATRVDTDAVRDVSEGKRVPIRPVERILAVPDREVDSHEIELHRGPGSRGGPAYFQRRDDEQAEPFLAVYFPEAGTYNGLDVPADGYAIDRAGTAPIVIMRGIEFRQEFEASRTAVRRVMRVSHKHEQEHVRAQMGYQWTPDPVHVHGEDLAANQETGVSFAPIGVVVDFDGRLIIDFEQSGREKPSPETPETPSKVTAAE